MLCSARIKKLNNYQMDEINEYLEGNDATSLPPRTCLDNLVSIRMLTPGDIGAGQGQEGVVSALITTLPLHT